MFIFKEKRGVAVKLMEKQNVLKLTRFKSYFVPRQIKKNQMKQLILGNHRIKNHRG